MAFRALVVRKDGDGPVTGAVEELNEDTLPQDGEVLVEVECPGLNFKDGLCMTGGGRLVREYPHIPGVDMAGCVVESGDDRYKPGDRVILTGWRYGEIWWGGYAQKTRVKADWLVPMPANLTSSQAMAIGTAGLAAILGVAALEDHGITPDKGEVIVTGATGGVGSLSVSMLANRGYRVAAVTGQADAADYLKSIGAETVIAREDLSEPSPKPLESGRWAGCIDSVGSTMLSRIITQMAYGGTIAAIGNASGIGLETNILPFLRRGVNLLGIDSVMQPYENRMRCWNNAGEWMQLDTLDSMIRETRLEEMMELGSSILEGKVKGRVVVNPSL